MYSSAPARLHGQSAVLRIANVQTLAGLPDLDRTVGRAFLQRASASEFVTAMTAFAALPRDLLGAAEGPIGVAEGKETMSGDSGALDDVKAVLLRSSLRTACDPEARHPPVIWHGACKYASGSLTCPHCMQVVRHAHEHLAVLDHAAAAENDMLRLFTSRARFPGVFQRHEELVASERALEELLPGLAKLAGTHKLTYKSIQNQVRAAPAGVCTSVGTPTLRLCRRLSPAP